MEWMKTILTSSFVIANGVFRLWWDQITSAFSHGSIIAGLIFFIFDLLMFPVACGIWLFILIGVFLFLLACAIVIFFFKGIWWLIRLPFCLLFKRELPEF